MSAVILHGPWHPLTTMRKAIAVQRAHAFREANGVPHPPRASVTILPTVGRLAARRPGVTFAMELPSRTTTSYHASRPQNRD